MNFDYEGARREGYTDEEIKEYLGNRQSHKPHYETFKSEDSGWERIKKNYRNFFGNLSSPVESKEEQTRETPVNPKLSSKFPNFDYEGALSEGYTPEEINEHLESKLPKKSNLEKGARLGAQYGLGLLEGSAPGFAYDVSVAPLASEYAMGQAYRENVLDDLERLREQKEMGIWDDKDQELYDHLLDQIENPENAKQYVKTADIGIRGLAEKATGQDLHPEGLLEKTANILGFLRHPEVFSKDGNKILGTLGLNKKQIQKNLFPSLKEIPRGLGAAAGLELAEQNQLGPIGSLTAMVVGDVMGGGLGGVGSAIMHPKRSLAKFINFATRSNSKKDLVKQLVNDFDKSGIKLDAGTLTQSPLVQMMQSRLAQSGLTGESFQNARKELSQQIAREYENIVGDLGEIAFENNYQASEAIKEALKVEEINLNIPKNQPPAGRSLKGRISVEKPPEYQQEFLKTISPEEFSSDAQAGQNLKTAANDIKDDIKRDFERRYSIFNEKLNDEVPIIVEPGVQEGLSSRLGKFVKEHEGSLLLGESTPEAKVLNSARNLMKKLSEGRAIKLNDLIKTKRTLQDIANWEFGGSDFLSAYKSIVGDLNASVEESLSRYDPNLLREYQELSADYSAFKDLFENRNLKSLFEPKNINYNTIHNEFVKNSDKLRSLEDIFYNNTRGQQLIDQIKRDYAEGVINKKDLTPRDIRNLADVLGPQFNSALERFAVQHQHALEHPLPKAKTQRGLGIRPSVVPKSKSLLSERKASLTGTERSREGVRKKYYEYISKKSPEQIMKKMDTVKGIHELKRVLELTPEGKELFKKLSRLKLAQMIDSKMKDAINGNIKLGTFAKLLSTPEEKSIVRELIGDKSYEKLSLLQKNSGKLIESAEKFYNASQSGTTLTDVGLIGAAATGLLTGNPFLAIPAMSKIGGSRVLANLLVDPKFLKELELSILTENPKKFIDYLKKMEPYVNKAIREELKSEQQEYTQ